MQGANRSVDPYTSEIYVDSLRSDRRPLRSPEESKKEEVGIKKFGETKKEEEWSARNARHKR